MLPNECLYRLDGKMRLNAAGEEVKTVDKTPMNLGEPRVNYGATNLDLRRTRNRSNAKVTKVNKNNSRLDRLADEMEEIYGESYDVFITRGGTVLCFEKEKEQECQLESHTKQSSWLRERFTWLGQIARSILGALVNLPKSLLLMLTA